MNSIAGLISTIVNVYSAQNGQYSITAKITTVVTGACTVITAGLFLLYNNWALERVKKRHERETSRMQNSQNEHKHDHEGVVEKVKRKVHEPGLEPSSVV
jgi:ABC-type nickel/cobalt efflux system permease component RcnA